MKTRAELDFELDRLATWIPTMLVEVRDVDRMEAFASEATLIEDVAGPDDATYVSARLAKMLVENCMVPAEEGPWA